MLAATAALLDAHPQRALVFLKRLSKYASGPAAHLLLALALNQLNKRIAAKTLLERNNLSNVLAAAPAFPGGSKHLPWLMHQLAAILGGELPWHNRRPAARAKIRPKIKPEIKLKTATKHATADRPRKGQHAAAATAPPPPPSPPPLPRVDIEIPFTIEFDAAPLLSAVAREAEPDGRWFALRERFAHLGLAQGFDELLCLPQLTGVEPLVHQIETVRKVLKQFRGRVLLADEVGLGKTIEAGMVLKEYALRGMAERSLVLTPASLVGQWREELESKFGLAFATTYDALLRDAAAGVLGSGSHRCIDRHRTAARARRTPCRAPIRSRHRRRGAPSARPIESRAGSSSTRSTSASCSCCRQRRCRTI